jgi:hypothetical protein
VITAGGSWSALAGGVDLVEVTDGVAHAAAA